jgi:hypothetical protein
VLALAAALLSALTGLLLAALTGLLVLLARLVLSALLSALARLLILLAALVRILAAHIDSFSVRRAPCNVNGSRALPFRDLRHQAAPRGTRSRFGWTLGVEPPRLDKHGEPARTSLFG